MTIVTALQIASITGVHLNLLTLVAALVESVVRGTTETQFALVHWDTGTATIGHGGECGERGRRGLYVVP